MRQRQIRTLGCGILLLLAGVSRCTEAWVASHPLAPRLVTTRIHQTPPPSDPSPETTTTPTTTTSNDTWLGRYLRGLWKTGMQDRIPLDAVVVAKRDIPEWGIYMDQTYEVTAIYWQGIDDETQQVQRIDLPEVILPQNNKDEDNASRTSIPAGYTQYMELYNPLYHDRRPLDMQDPDREASSSRGVKVTPEEVGLVSLRDEVLDSMLFALPVLGFWTTLSGVFVQTYHDRYGGTVWDALLGR